jgi:RNA polymerase sigma-54 factor
LIVKKSKDGWLVELNNSTLPDIKIKKDEARSLLTKVKDTNEKIFVKDKINQANWLANAIKKRSETLLKVGSEIVKRQQEFLEFGASKIQPMILADIAEAIGMHESTISRTTTGSLMQTPQGTLEMKAFFSVALSKGGNYDETSAASLKFQIKKLIESEDPKNPLSDEYIVELFAKKGIKVARRTVAKYRKLDNIPSSFARKRRNILAGL